MAKSAPRGRKPGGRRGRPSSDKIEEEQNQLPQETQATAEATENESDAKQETPNTQKMSAAEAKRAEEESTHAKYERIKKGQLYLSELQRLSVSELHEVARKEGITEYSAMKKQDLIFKVLKERIRQNGLMYGEGVLEVLPDGYGFLRNPSYNYLSSPDDIYVSPSQIKRFGLRTGNVVSGQIRPPKESEKYFALLRVEAINFEDPDKLSEKAVFSDLTPLHP
ncbi:MAG: Rho termination factor N-terminal domain-containing protein, partial [Phycisphaerae bacterium]